MADDAALMEDAFGPLNPTWAPAATPGVPVVDFQVTRLYGEQLTGKPLGVRVDQGSPAWLRLPLYSARTGGPVTIAVGGYSTPPAVQVRYREASGYDNRVYGPDAGDTPALEAAGTTALLPLPVELKNAPGVYGGQCLVRDGAGVEQYRSNFTVLVDRGLFTADGAVPQDRGPPTFDEVRTALRDHPGANRLLGEYAWDPAEIGQALTGAVQTFNTTLPVGGRGFTTATFPAAWRRQMIDGALAYLFETAAEYMRRGHLPYSAGGMAVDDLAKEQDYQKAAALYRDRFEKWCRLTKTRLSVEAGWGGVGSGATWYGGYGGGMM